ncbi:GNAT family N-acetyltransferase [Sphingosinicella sp. BN140058]|uniref:GNAT family N-acetyltransferase n=1 Tax=Sphingosinicella sp. BN140058 TaxID=1892855 RepID=UPI001010C28F|nr:GNAT family N-acetyltransferase [Sphingosinicella sp. BN140058]QAY75691.1 GNAT family N-acetyltransferase [Sphingosinicella sp. BN140058]
MAESDRDKMLKEMAANRGCRLVKSRRRTPGVGDYGRYGLKDAGTDRDVFGIAADGLTASPEEIESFLRKGLVADWKSSLAAAAATPPAKSSKSGTAAAATPPAERPSKAAQPRAGAEPPPRSKPKLRIVAPAAERPRPRPAPAPSPPPPPPSPPPAPAPLRAILKVRDARPADAAGIADLLGAGTTKEAVARRIAALRKAGQAPIVAEEDRDILACLTWHAVPLLQDDAPLGRISLLIVAQRMRRRGIGRTLVEEALARLADAGCTRVEAMAEIELGAAPDFFRRIGWTRAAYLYARSLEE